MKLPAQYEWVLGVEELPLTIVEGLKEFGVLETPGPGNNPRIIGWADEIGRNDARRYAKWADGFIEQGGDAIPWCGLYAGVICLRARKAIPEKYLSAAEWVNFGQRPPVSDPARLGDVLVFRRSGGGHVGFYVAEDATAYHVLGGNQSDRVSIARIEKSRCIGVRRPVYTNMPWGARPFTVAASGELSTNEA